MKKIYEHKSRNSKSQSVRNEYVNSTLFAEKAIGQKYAEDYSRKFMISTSDLSLTYSESNKELSNKQNQKLFAMEEVKHNVRKMA